MTAPRPWLVLVFGAILVLAHPHLAAALGDTDVKAGACSIATGGNATNNTVTCNFGLTPEQLREATKAAVAGATEPLLDRIDKVRTVLGVTRSAAEKLLKIAGEQPDVPDEKLAEVLTSVAADYQRLKAQAAALNPDNPTARALVAQAKAAIEAGHSHKRTNSCGKRRRCSSPPRKRRASCANRPRPQRTPSYSAQRHRPRPRATWR